VCEEEGCCCRFGISCCSNDLLLVSCCACACACAPSCTHALRACGSAVIVILICNGDVICGGDVMGWVEAAIVVGMILGIFARSLLPHVAVPEPLPILRCSQRSPRRRPKYVRVPRRAVRTAARSHVHPPACACACASTSAFCMGFALCPACLASRQCGHCPPHVLLIVIEHVTDGFLHRVACRVRVVLFFSCFCSQSNAQRLINGSSDFETSGSSPHMVRFAFHAGPVVVTHVLFTCKHDPSLSSYIPRRFTLLLDTVCIR
jgi:hypothetical protein